jgi:uncharacterized protein YegL
MFEGGLKLTTVAVACAVSMVVACSGANDAPPDGTSAFGNDAGPSGQPGTGSDHPGLANNGDAGSGTGFGFGNDAGTSPSPTGDAAACATTTAQAERLPLSLVFMYDRSDSMAGVKWNSTSQGIEAFFADPQSQGTSASLAFFCGKSCTASTYQTPSVALSALPDTKSFTQSIQAQTLCGGTPTAAAIEGAVAYAQSVKQQQPTGDVVVALITDGQPTTCGGMTGATAAAMAGATAGIKTYVIGVGSSLQNLDALAAAGGTSKAILVDTANPAQLATDFEKAIDSIRVSALSCELAIPAAHAGATLDVNKVNVTVTSGGNTTTLNYDAQCAGAGWRYDDVNAPTKVELCPATCAAAKADLTTRVDLVFGCATQGGTPK